MKPGFLALALLALTGCQTIQEHPRAAAIVGAVLVTSVALSARSGSHERMPEVSSPLVACEPAERCQ